MEKPFTKYRKYGGYHHKLWNSGSPRYVSHVNKVKEWVKEKNVLDVGAGDGLITHILGITGIDNEPYAIKAAKRRGVDIVLGSAYNLPFKDEEFDSVFMGDTMEHFEEPMKAIKEARRVLKKYIYIVIPRKESRMEPFQYHDWTPEEFKRDIENEGFKLEGEIELDNKKYYGKFLKV